MIYARYYNKSTNSFVNIYLGKYIYSSSLRKRMVSIPLNLFILKGSNPGSYKSFAISKKKTQNHLTYNIAEIVAMKGHNEEIGFSFQYNKKNIHINPIFNINAILRYESEHKNDLKKEEKKKLADINIEEQEVVTINK